MSFDNNTDKRGKVYASFCSVRQAYNKNRVVAIAKNYNCFFYF